MKTKVLVVSLIVLVMSMMVGISSAQEATEEAPIVETVEDGRHTPIRDILREVMDIVTEATSLTQAEVLQQLRDGSTLSEIITANGGDVEAIKAEVTTLVTERIETAVTDGRLSRERADEMLANLPERIAQAFDEVHTMEARPFNMAEHGLFAYLIQEISDATSLTVQEINQAVQDGASLSEVITANGGDVATITTDVLAETNTRLSERVTNGDLTQEEADTILAQATEEIDGWLNGTLAFPIMVGRGEGRGGMGMGGEGRGGRGNGGMGGNGQGGNNDNGQGN